MKLAIIPPIKHLNLTEKCKYHLVLAHLLRNKNYRDFYVEKRKRGDYLIVDSGAYELKEPTPAEEILQLANEIDAQEFMLPDIRFDMKANIESNLNALKIDKIYNSKRKIHACIQGTTPGEYITCLRTFMGIDRVDVIGVTKGAMSRIEIVDYIDFMKYYEEKEFHLLGIRGNPIELKIINDDYKWVRSIDTKSPIFYGNLGLKFDRTRGLITDKDYKKEEKKYFKIEKLKFKNIIKHNIKTMKEWCK